MKHYDIIVVGAGHAGCEAATAAANLGKKTLLITINLETIAQMSCNPAIGGIAKGQIVREIDALGGCTGKVADMSSIQFRMLNLSKGAAVWSPRSQCDKEQFSAIWKQILHKTDNLFLREDTVIDLILEDKKAVGVKTKLGETIFSECIVLTTGTFLNGKIHIGEVSFSGGRIGELSADDISQKMKKIGFKIDRLKTGTPVRIDGRTIDFSKMEKQESIPYYCGFSFVPVKSKLKQLPCWITYTSQEVHQILQTGFEKSPMFQGRIQGVGPRYCPSIEDKIVRFSERNRHQLFLEPETESGFSYYLNGFSSSLPEKVQIDALHKIEGLENAHILKPGYAIEYDYFSPIQLYASLESKIIKNLFFAGQINGTTGYEEAAAQGLMAGINAARKINDLQPIILKRNEAYIGVLIDDLITKGVDEPYRMFTSRAEYRILLRQNNADLRLTKIGFEIGLIDKNRFQQVKKKEKKIEEMLFFLKNTSIEPSQINPFLQQNNLSEISQKTKLSQLLLRPQISLQNLCSVSALLQQFIDKKRCDISVLEESEIVIKYENYIEKEKNLAAKMNDLDNIKIPPNWEYNNIQSLSTEARQKLSKFRPSNLGQASRISGVSPSDISVLIIMLNSKINE
ncbi:MAG: tRNA uridine-5-carboxymethylaminomethyl(34) synthesis enzyme MnmG [Bacteroidales bacterium]|nr:tRNA uridine-5-carboxymethylaminomethyl(34) synthesis enzyme MnmG [Bacteroidales bacterium]